MKIKDIMEQTIRTINLLKGAREIPLHSIMGDVKVLDIISEEYNCLLEWLVEGMTEMNLHDLYNEKSFLKFWETFKLEAKYDQEHFIDEIPGINLLDLFHICNESDIFEVAYNKIEKELSRELTPEEQEAMKAKLTEIGPDFYHPHRFVENETTGEKDYIKLYNSELKDEKKGEKQ